MRMYPGVRSDSDMHTLGYKFKPWTAQESIADGSSILSYLQQVVRVPPLAPALLICTECCYRSATTTCSSTLL